MASKHDSSSTWKTDFLQVVEEQLAILKTNLNFSPNVSFHSLLKHGSDDIITWSALNRFVSTTCISEGVNVYATVPQLITLYWFGHDPLPDWHEPEIRFLDELCSAGICPEKAKMLLSSVILLEFEGGTARYCTDLIRSMVSFDDTNTDALRGLLDDHIRHEIYRQCGGFIPLFIDKYEEFASDAIRKCYEFAYTGNKYWMDVPRANDFLQQYKLKWIASGRINEM